MSAHSALIAVLILDRPLCLDCISAKSNIARAEVDRCLDAIAQAPLELRRAENGRCRNCGEDDVVFSLHRAPDVGPAEPPRM